MPNVNIVISKAELRRFVEDYMDFEEFTSIEQAAQDLSMLDACMRQAFSTTEEFRAVTGPEFYQLLRSFNRRCYTLGLEAVVTTPIGSESTCAFIPRNRVYVTALETRAATAYRR